MIVKEYPSQERLKELYTYRDGNLYVKKSTSNRMKVGQRAGHHRDRANNNYSSISVEGVQGLSLSRLIWIWHNGDIPEGHVIHHNNGQQWDNHIENLSLHKFYKGDGKPKKQRRKITGTTDDIFKRKWI